ncbi:prolipoprotein diacylglyceryl transferase [Thalassoglobus sp.]|uniref:prolipoprotein diacylglyceryl transferase n=1 Tax=Thalassoglobus sp. TaxID=2795869 RepID=UPI003AA885CD
MRQTLFRIWIEKPWSLWTEVPGAPPHLGACWIAIIVGAVLFLYHLARRDQEFLRDRVNWLMWGCAILGLSIAPFFGVLPASVPVFGYGAMVLIGFVSAMAFSCARAKAVGHNPEIILDAALWVLGIGIFGGRLAYLIQYGDVVFQDANSFGELAFAAINLSEGGLVQIGGLVGGTLGFLIFCRLKKVDFFEFADIMAPAIFIGIGFGRIGCLLNGCCYGDRCELPWGIEFASGTVTFNELVMKGFVDPDAGATFSLHPTQIYSSINGFVLAIVTGVYFWYRKYRGDVFALGCILYALTRIQIEFLRADEMGQLGTGFTISQFYSLGIIASGLGIMLFTRWRSQKLSAPTTQSQNPV